MLRQTLLLLQPLWVGNIVLAELNDVINDEAKPSCLCKVYHDAELCNLITPRKICIKMLLLHHCGVSNTASGRLWSVKSTILHVTKAPARMVMY